MLNESLSACALNEQMMCVGPGVFAGVNIHEIP